MSSSELSFFDSEYGATAFEDVADYLIAKSVDGKSACCLNPDGNWGECLCVAEISNMKKNGEGVSYNQTIQSLLSLACTAMVIWKESPNDIGNDNTMRRLALLVRSRQNANGSSTVYIDLDTKCHQKARLPIDPNDADFNLPVENMVKDENGNYMPKNRKDMMCAPSAVLFLRTFFQHEFGFFNRSQEEKEQARGKLGDLVYDWNEFLSAILEIGLAYYPNVKKRNTQNAYEAYVYQAYLHRPSTKKVEYYPFGESRKTSRFALRLNIDINESEEYVRQEIDRYKQLLQERNLFEAIHVLQPITVQKERKDGETAAQTHKEHPGLDTAALGYGNGMLVKAIQAIGQCTPSIDHSVWKDLSPGGMTGVYLWQLQGTNLFEVWQELDENFSVKKRIAELGVDDTSDVSLRHLSDEFTWNVNEMVAKLRGRIAGREYPQGANLLPKKFSLMCVDNHVPQAVTFDSENEDERAKMFTVMIALSKEGVFLEVFPDKLNANGKRAGTLFHLPRQMAAVLWGCYAITPGLKATVAKSAKTCGSHMRLLVHVFLDVPEPPAVKPCSVISDPIFEHSPHLKSLNCTFFDADGIVHEVNFFGNHIEEDIRDEAAAIREAKRADEECVHDSDGKNEHGSVTVASMSDEKKEGNSDDDSNYETSGEDPYSLTQYFDDLQKRERPRTSQSIASLYFPTSDNVAGK